MTSSEVCALIERETGKAVTEDTSIEALGVDSLEFLNLLLAIENESGVKVNESLIPLSGNVGSIIAAVTQLPFAGWGVIDDFNA